MTQFNRQPNLVFLGIEWKADYMLGFWDKTHEERLEFCGSTARGSSEMMSFY